MLDFYYCDYGNYRNREIKPLNYDQALAIDHNVIVSNHYKSRYIPVLDVDGDYNVRATVSKLKELDILQLNQVYYENTKQRLTHLNQRLLN